MGEVLGRAVSGTEAVSREQWPERLKNGLDALNIRYDPATPERLARYHQLLTEWNQVMNLTGDTDLRPLSGGTIWIRWLRWASRDCFPKARA